MKHLHPRLRLLPSVVATTLNDFIVIWFDRIEYFFRGLGCRVAGHQWEAENEEMGDVVYLVGWVCKRCHQAEPRRTQS